MASPTPQFRLATVDDATQVRELVQAAFRAPDNRQGWTADMELGARFHIGIEEVTATITRADSAILMATVAGNLVASVHVAKRSNGHARLSMLSVDAAHQSNGLGRQVLEYAEAYCQRAWAATTVDLDALSTREHLLAWYQRRGYRKTGGTSPFPREKFSDLHLPVDLCFIEMEKDLS
ncbi:hypothetical protein JDV02_002000 [Purpureocillium takamizusanense]|uniref:N-acetyltransferase domain-containing protein n=1 Tax=Purpureocillium takamizusanense TaxID=2060973 RepID=A0A9Q8V707_9HYPO|nr:uncharacterized protein JDV02_002000 [Purpureocillium takamizusanense]UNI15470.1 hypothetical protein JDV02_002000 [Purpureocillium takamizusanense]